MGTYTVDQFITVRFPGCNKQCTLADNDEAITARHNDTRCKVRKVLTVPAAVYDVLGDTLMNNNTIWEQIGGSDADGFDGVSFTSLMANQELLKRFRETCWVNVVIVTDGHRTFAVNTEGYDYARYTGRVIATE